MTNTKANRTSDTVDLFPHQFDMTKTYSEDSSAIIESKLIPALENPTPALPLKVEQPALADIKNYQKCSNVQYNHQRPNGHSKVINFQGCKN